MNKHTPGDWAVGWGNGLTGTGAAASVYWDETGVIYKPVHVGDEALAYVVGPNQEANARLIAAAPDLLEALRECVSDLEAWEESQETARILKLARAAIAKAEGK